jgi:lipopolysaccharide transport system ATP-binding protein
MQDVTKDKGRTVLFVSHNMAAVRDLCRSAIVLSNGEIRKTGNTKEMINFYMESSVEIELKKDWTYLENSPGDASIKIRKIYSVNSEVKHIPYYLVNEHIGVCIEYEVLNEVPFFTHGINVFNSEGIHLFTSHDNAEYKFGEVIKAGTYRTMVWIQSNLLQDGDYFVSFAAMRYNPFVVLFHEKDLLRIQVLDTMVDSSKSQYCNREFPGLVRPKLNWEIREKIIL